MSIALRLPALLIALCVSISACATPRPTTPPVPAFNNSALTTVLQRGVSTPADVRAAIGEPHGQGGFLSPGDPTERQVWYYEKFEFAGAGKSFDIQQNILLVFFKDGRYDGFLWFSDAQKNW